MFFDLTYIIAIILSLLGSIPIVKKYLYNSLTKLIEKVSLLSDLIKQISNAQLEITKLLSQILTSKTIITKALEDKQLTRNELLQISSSLENLIKGLEKINNISEKIQFTLKNLIF